MDFHIQSNNLSVRGEVAGASDYVLRPTAASVAGAARRLHARAFRVAALMKLVQAEAEKRCESATAERDLAAYQVELDQWSLAECRGELIFHVAPESKIAARRGHPLEGALVNGARWNTAAFRGSWGVSGTIQCAGCGATATSGHDDLCVYCVEDDELGGLLATAESVTISAPGHKSIEVPVDPAQRYPSPDFAELIGYLAITREATAAATEPAVTPEATAPSATAGLFSFPLGGHQIVIGPWERVLRAALAIEPKESKSAGLVFASPHANMRSAAHRAVAALHHAGAGHFSLDGEMLDWKSAGQIVERAFEMAGWLKEDRITSSTLRRIGELHRMSQGDPKEENAGKYSGTRYLPMLVWQGRDADRLLRMRILRLAADRDQWQSTGLVTELAFLAASAANADSSGGRNG